MRPSIRPLRSLLAASSLLLLAGLISCGDGKPSRKDRHHDDHASVDATQATNQSDPTDDGKKDKHKHDKDKKDEAAAATDAGSSAPASTGNDEKSKKADKRTHDHTAKPTDVQWLLTMHGEDGKPQGVWGLTGEGELKGPVNAPLPNGPAGLAPHDLRGLTPLPGGGFLVMNAYSKDTRILHFGAKDANGQYPFVGNFVQLGPKNPAMVHAYQMAISAEGQVYVSNQDTNTVTRYVGLGQPNAGEVARRALGMLGTTNRTSRSSSSTASLLAALRGRRIHFVGDSVLRQLCQAVMCRLRSCRRSRPRGWP